jgi:NTP pyrophosphatase (non-canonical NTP hydrolase)
MSIKEFQEMIKKIYGKTNSEHGHDFDYFFSYLVRTISSGFKRIRYNNDPSEKFAKSISYICGLCELLKVDLQESFLKRFPNICPYCLVSPCRCYETNKKSALNIPQRKYKEELEYKYSFNMQEISKREITVDFDYIAEMVSNIYPSNKLYWNVFRGPEYHIMKCLEELGEIQEAYSLYMGKNTTEPLSYVNVVTDEICDLLAWLVNAWRLACNNINISEYVSRMYRNMCPSCNRAVCECKSRHTSSDMLWRKEEIENLNNLLLKLDFKDDDFLSLLDQYQDALQENSNTLYKLCVRRTVTYLTTLSLPTADKHVDDLDRALKNFEVKI